MGPPATVKLTSKIINTLQGISTLHMLPHCFTAPKFQHRARKRQEGSVPAYIPMNTWQVWRFQIPFRCSSVRIHPPAFLPISKNVQNTRLASEHSHKHCVKMKAFALLALAKMMLAEHLTIRPETESRPLSLPEHPDQFSTLTDAQKSWQV